MQKLFLLLFIPIYLFAFTSKVNIFYKEGLDAYKEHDFKTSYTLFQKIYLKNLSNINFNFYFGRSAYETGHYETALAAFERVSMLDNTNIRNKLETARTYFMLKMYADAENLYREVLSNPSLPKNIRKNIELSLSKVSKVQKKSFTYATLMLNTLYDSNINYANFKQFSYNGLLLPQGTRLSDTALQIFANVTNIYDIGEKNGFALKNSFSFFSKNYKHHKDFNINYITYNPSLIYKVTHYTAELVGGIDMLQLAGKKYLSSFSIMPYFEYNHTPTLHSIASFKYQRKTFSQIAQKDLDADRFEFMYALQNILTPRSYVQVNLYGATEHRLRGRNLYVDFNEEKLHLEYANQFSRSFAVDIFGELCKRNYKDFSIGFQSTRKDFSKNIGIGINYQIIPKLNARLSSSYEYIDSTQDQFTYQKQITSVSLIKTF